MTNYFKDVNDLGEWLSDQAITGGERYRRSYVRNDQQDRAKRAIAEGGFLLSYVKGVPCWAGISRIVGSELRKAPDGNAWDKAFGSYFDIEPIHLLRTPAKCFLAREATMCSGHDGRGIYNHMLDANVCERIRKQIENVDGKSDHDAEAEASSDSGFSDFMRSWDDSLHRSTFLRSLVIEQSGGCCSVCAVTKQEWIDRVVGVGKWPAELDIQRIRDDGFQLLHVHHREHVAKIGTLMAVCPNCHDLLTRAGTKPPANSREGGPHPTSV